MAGRGQRDRDAQGRQARADTDPVRAVRQPRVRTVVQMAPQRHRDLVRSQPSQQQCGQRAHICARQTTHDANAAASEEPGTTDGGTDARREATSRNADTCNRHGRVDRLGSLSTGGIRPVLG